MEEDSTLQLNLSTEIIKEHTKKPKESKQERVRTKYCADMHSCCFILFQIFSKLLLTFEKVKWFDDTCKKLPLFKTATKWD